MTILTVWYDFSKYIPNKRCDKGQFGAFGIFREYSLVKAGMLKKRH